MANSFLTPDVIAKEALLQFKNNMGFTRSVNKQYSPEFAKKGAKIGDSIRIRKPNRYVVSNGATFVGQDTTEENVTLQLNNQKHVGMNFSAKDMTLTIEEFSDRYVKPAALALANKVDQDGLQLAQDVYNAVGTPGTTPSALLTYLQAQQKVSESAGPDDENYCFGVNPAASTAIVDALKGLFQSSSEIDKQYKRGLMGMAAGGEWKRLQNIYTHTVGAYAGTPLVNGGSQTGASLVTDGWSSGASALAKGDIFTIAGVFKVNPLTKQSTGALQQFVVTAAVSDTSGAKTIAISPSIVTSGALQTVNASPADNAAITVLGAASTVSPCNLLYHKDAFVMGMADLVLPEGVDMAARAVDEESGLSVRLVRQYDANEDNFITRLDVLYGWLSARPEFACRIQG